MKRGKPQQQIYRPGSGPLRKSNSGVEETDTDSSNLNKSHRKNYQTTPQTNNDDLNLNSTTDNLKNMTLKEVPKRARKPEQLLYVPKVIANARISQSQSPQQQQQQSQDNSYHERQNINGNYDNDRYMNRSKRYSNRRRGGGGNDNTTDYHDEWRDNRKYRQGSEPRTFPNNVTTGGGGGGGGGGQFQRMRDTRSVEPSVINTHDYNNDKLHNKPPSGRRHSTIGLESDKRHKPMNVDRLPPRLKKKFLEENNLNNQTPSDDCWDGNSLTFQGNHPTNYSKNPNYYQHHPRNNYAGANQNINSYNPGYNTLPHRNRGRGRAQRDYYDNERPHYRSMTPESIGYSPHSSRPPTPTSLCSNRTRSSDNLNRQHYDSRPQSPANNYYQQRRNYNENSKYNNGSSSNRGNESYRRHQDQQQVDGDSSSSSRTPRPSGFRESLENQLSPVSPPTPEEKTPTNFVSDANTTILDWSEEVELNDRLEAEILSDAPTRSSSITSLVDISTKSMPVQNTFSVSKKPRSRKNGKRSRRRSGSMTRDSSLDNQFRHQKSYNDNYSRGDTFKVPQEPRPRHRRNSRDKRDTSYERYNRHNRSRECSFDRNGKNSITNETENWREEIIRSRQNSERNSSDNIMNRSRKNSELDSEQINRSRKNSERDNTDLKGINTKKAGVIILPNTKQTELSTSPTSVDRPKYPDVRKSSTAVTPSGQQQKSLFDPNNPTKPIIVKSPNSRVNVPGFSSDNIETTPPQMYTTDQYGNIRPGWYDESTDGFKLCHYPNLIKDIKRADNELQFMINSGQIISNWGIVIKLRKFLKDSLEYLLCNDMKFCQSENVEQHLWKISYHNLIEITRKSITIDLEHKDHYKEFLLYLIDEGTEYFESLLERLEDIYKFKLNNYLGNNHTINNHKGLGYIGLALISAQKLFLFLGDLARYREQVNETSNYGKCRQWYIKAHEINPKNGRPYNQLAVLAVYARRKLDAVYYYMRSLMSSNPVPSARECLISLFDENRKKYEQGERKRREERQERARQHMKEKESENFGNSNGSLRREIWIRPDGGKRVHRTTQTLQEQKDSEEEDLAGLSSVEVNKRFVISYLHVHGKLITRIGMESFHEAAMQMLKEFRALLQHSPVPLPSNRFLQLLALNMFAIESTQLKDPHLKSQSGYRSEVQERALVVSLQMFNLILERSVSLLQEHLDNNNSHENINQLPQDAHVLLPAIKIWCDWMLCHSSVWNPPPSTQDFKVGTAGDAWSRLAILMNLLEQLDQSIGATFISELQEGYESVRLPEDGVLSGFTPLMINEPEPNFVPKDIDMELAQFSLRLNKLLFFGTVFLCGLEPPVLKLEIEDDLREYVSVVSTSNSRDSPPSPQELVHNNDVILESFSEDEDDDDDDETMNKVNEDAPSDIRDLLSRKVELEKKHKHQQLHMQRVKKILSQSVVSVHIEVRPKYLVPDTNCFIDHLDCIVEIAKSHVYTLMIPIIVLSELEGLGRGGKSPMPLTRSFLDPQHVRIVAQSAKRALSFLKNRSQSVKCVTTKGAILTSMTFTTEDDSTLDSTLKNDDKILATCLVLCKGYKESQSIAEGEPRKLISEVVLLTDDRNLRVKALARDVPVRELLDFMRWAGLG